jgi:hypothetical protein
MIEQLVDGVRELDADDAIGDGRVLLEALPVGTLAGQAAHRQRRSGACGAGPPTSH